MFLLLYSSLQISNNTQQLIGCRANEYRSRCWRKFGATSRTVSLPVYIYKQVLFYLLARRSNASSTTCEYWILHFAVLYCLWLAYSCQVLQPRPNISDTSLHIILTCSRRSYAFSINPTPFYLSLCYGVCAFSHVRTRGSIWISELLTYLRPWLPSARYCLKWNPVSEINGISLRPTSNSTDSNTVAVRGFWIGGKRIGRVPPPAKPMWTNPRGLGEFDPVALLSRAF